MGSVRGFLALALVIMLTVGAAGPSAAARNRSAAGGTLNGWFLQVSSLSPTYSPATVAGWLAQTCSMPAAQRPTLVLQDIVDAKGALATSYLDRIAPYLPGGRLHCIGRVFVGSVQPQWTGQGSLYVEGIQDAGFRASYVDQSRRLARQFANRYPQLTFDWYLPFEANMNELYYPAAQAAYSDV